MQKLLLNFVDSITEIGADDWNSLAGTENPFTRYEFLLGLELTGCTNEASGWQPHHVLVRKLDGDNETSVAVMPLYLKTNSYGEYVFDWSWANAYQSHGLEYYPKFVTAVPFTPSVGSRLFVAPGIDATQVINLITEKVEEKARHIHASS